MGLTGQLKLIGLTKCQFKRKEPIHQNREGCQKFLPLNWLYYEET